jgi:alkylated DNA repair dioxygenase AlkB
MHLRDANQRGVGLESLQFEALAKSNCVLALPELRGAVAFVQHWLAAAQADSFFRRLMTELSLSQQPIMIFGREVLQPRLTLWMGDKPYRYSGKTLAPAPWTDAMLALREQVARSTGVQFNTVLCNLYRDGNDSMGFHSDDEPELGPTPVIASISFGATRRLLFRPRKHVTGERARERREFALSHGSLLVMDGQTQKHLLHGIPKQLRVRESRLNLTFRQIDGG